MINVTNRKLYCTLNSCKNYGGKQQDMGDGKVEHNLATLKYHGDTSLYY